MESNRTVKASYFIHKMFIYLFVLFFVIGSVGIKGTVKAQEEIKIGADVISDSPSSIFGVEMVRINNDLGLSQMASAGTSWVRVNGVVWSNIEPNPDELHWELLTDLDTQIDNAIANNMEVILVVRSTPSWAQKNPGYYCGPIAANNLKDFADFMGELVTRYQNKVKYWEIWNEPDAPLGTPPSTADYGCWGDPSDTLYYGGSYFSDMLNLVYPAIKEVDPTAQVIVGGLLMDCGPGGNCPNTNILKFIDGIIQNGMGSNFDGIAFHAYDYYQGGLGNYSNAAWNASRATTGPVELLKANYLLNKLSQNGLYGKFIMNSELAVVCNSGCDDPNSVNSKNFEDTKAYYVAQSYSGAIAKGLKAGVWYGAKMGWRQSDLLYSNLTPRTAYNAYVFARSEIGDAKFSRNITQYPGVMGYELNRSDRRVWVLWSMNGVTNNVTLPELPLAIYDVDGNPRAITTTVAIKLEPYYIELPAIYGLNLPLVNQNYQPILNANFERGLNGGNPVNWTITSGGGAGLPAGLISSPPSYPVADTLVPMGNYSMQLGLQNYGDSCAYPVVPIGYAGIQQTFKVPYTLGSTGVKVSFRYIIYTQDASLGVNYDWFEVHIIDGASDQTLFRDGNKINAVCAWQRVPTSGWGKGTIDLVSPTDYRGKSVTISFQNWNRNDGFYNTFTYLDQVIVEIGDPIP